MINNKISVAIATFNGQQYIGELLQSIINQTYSVDEIVIYDDNSTDNTLQIIRSSFIEKNSPELKIFTGNNVGHAKNFERAINNTNGNIIFLADQDDLWEPLKVEKIITVFESSPDILGVFTDGYVVNSTLNYSGFNISQVMQYPFGEFKQDVVFPCNWATFRNTVVGATFSFRREILKIAFPIPDNVYHHDSWLSKHCSYSGGLLYLNTPLIKYRQHSNNVIGMTTGFFKKILDIKKSSLKSLQEMKRLEIELTIFLSRANPISVQQKNSLEQIKSWQYFLFKRIEIIQDDSFFNLLIFIKKNLKDYKKHINGLRSAFIDLMSFIYISKL